MLLEQNPDAAYAFGLGDPAFPVTSGLKGLFFLGGSLADSIKNRAPGATQDGAFVGAAPTLGAAYWQHSGDPANYFESNLPCTDSYTWMAACTPVQSGSVGGVAVMSAYSGSGPSTRIHELSVHTGGALSAVKRITQVTSDDNSNTNGSSLFNVANATNDWWIIAGGYDATQSAFRGGSAVNRNHAEIITRWPDNLVSVPYTHLIPTTTVRFGTNNIFGECGPFKLGIVAIWDRYLLDRTAGANNPQYEMRLASDWMRRYLAERGIVA